MDKKSLTKLFLEQTGGDTSDKSIKECLVTWWVAPFSPIGLRLTPAGSKFLDKIVGLQKYKFKIKEMQEKYGKASIPNPLNTQFQAN